MSGSPAAAIAAAAALASRRQLRGSSNKPTDKYPPPPQQHQEQVGIGTLVLPTTVPRQGQQVSGMQVVQVGGLEAASNGSRGIGAVSPAANMRLPVAAPAGQRDGTNVIPAVGAWAAAAEQLRAQRQAAGAGARGSDGYQGASSAASPGDVGPSKVAAGSLGLVGSKGAPAATPGAVRPRGGMGRAAVGPLLRMLRAQAEEQQGQPE